MEKIHINSFSISCFQFIYIYSENPKRAPSGPQNSARHREFSAR